MRRIARLLLVTCPFLAALGVGFPSIAAPPSPAPPAPTPKGGVPQPSLGAPLKVAAARKAGGQPYVSGPLAIEVEVANTTATETTARLVLAEGPQHIAEGSGRVPANGRAWIAVTDPNGLTGGCAAKPLRALLLGTTASVELSVQPTCTFTATTVNSEEQTKDDYIDYARAGKLYFDGFTAKMTSARYTCGTGLIGSVRLKNLADAPATDVRMMFDGNRSNVGTVQPGQSSTGSFFAAFDGRHGSYRLSLEGSGVRVHSPPWSVNVARSCSIAITVR